jgi:hypothetical protein
MTNGTIAKQKRTELQRRADDALELAYPLRLDLVQGLAESGKRRPRCKRKSDVFAKRSSAAMYPAFERSRFGC